MGPSIRVDLIDMGSYRGLSKPPKNWVVVTVYPHPYTPQKRKQNFGYCSCSFNLFPVVVGIRKTWEKETLGTSTQKKNVPLANLSCHVKIWRISSTEEMPINTKQQKTNRVLKTCWFLLAISQHTNVPPPFSDHEFFFQVTPPFTFVWTPRNRSSSQSSFILLSFQQIQLRFQHTKVIVSTLENPSFKVLQSAVVWGHEFHQDVHKSG